MRKNRVFGQALNLLHTYYIWVEYNIKFKLFSDANPSGKTHHILKVQQRTVTLDAESWMRVNLLISQIEKPFYGVRH